MFAEKQKQTLEKQESTQLSKNGILLQIRELQTNFRIVPNNKDLRTEQEQEELSL